MPVRKRPTYCQIGPDLIFFSHCPFQHSASAVMLEPLFWVITALSLPVRVTAGDGWTHRKCFPLFFRNAEVVEW
ncbi:MAG: hypothetical protein ACYCYP_12265 [Leptospirales bacterium]